MIMLRAPVFGSSPVVPIVPQYARMAANESCHPTTPSHILALRSHCLVKVHVRASAAKKSTLLFVDLAGSERLQRTGNSGSAKVEAQSINSSLSALGRVIKALGAQGKGGKAHVPYRDTPLTMLLRDSFGGKSCTAVVINVAAEAEHADESVCSLKFGERMGLVRNAPTVVVSSGPSDAASRERVEQMLEGARKELKQMAVDGQGGGFVDGAPNSEVESLKSNMRKLADAEREVQQLVVDITEAKSCAPRGDAQDTALLEQKLRRLSEQAEVFRGIVERQQTIKTLWALPTPAFRRKVAEVKELEGHLTLLL